MQVVFRDAFLRRAAEDSAFCPPGWSAATAKTYRRKLQKLDAVHAVGDLFQVRSLGTYRSDEDPELFLIELDEEVFLALHVEVGVSGLHPLVVLDRSDVLRKEKSA